MSLKTEFSLNYKTLSKGEGGAIPVIVVAGGSSVRMKGTDKIFADICGIPAVIRTLLAFERNKYISDIFVVCREEKIADLSKLAKSYMISKLKAVTSGGSSRAESVKNGLALLDKNTENVLIHDGARPFVSDDIIERVVFADKKYNCVVCSVPCTDTVKQISGNTVKKTLKRDELVSVQTPQRVNYKMYCDFIKNTDSDLVTDDASVFEKNGEKVLNVEGSFKNIKITSPIDLKFAKIILEDLL